MKLTKVSINLFLSLIILLFFVGHTVLLFAGNIEKVKLGWTKEQVRTELGKPQNITHNVGQGEIWTYINSGPKNNLLGSLVEIVAIPLAVKIPNSTAMLGAVKGTHYAVGKVNTQGGVDNYTICFNTQGRVVPAFGFEEGGKNYNSAPPPTKIEHTQRYTVFASRSSPFLHRSPKCKKLNVTNINELMEFSSDEAENGKACNICNRSQ